MVETLSIAIIFIVTEIFKYIIAKIEKKTGHPMTKEKKGYVVLGFAFAISFAYSVFVATNIIDQSTINVTLQIFAGAMATYEVLYKRILVKIVNSIKK